MPAASGDDEALIARFYGFFSALPCRPDHMELLSPRPQIERVAEQDVVYVGGGNTVTLLALLRAHGVDRELRRAYEGGTMLAGVSAGAICWFEAGLSDSLGDGYAPIAGLGVLTGGFCPHADSEPSRLPALQAAVMSGDMPGSWAADDGAALLFEDERLAEVLAARPGRAVRRVERGDAGGVRWTSLPAGRRPFAEPWREGTGGPEQ